MEKLRFDTFYAVQQRVLAAGGTSTDIQTLTELCHLHELTQMHDEIGCFVLTSLRSLAASITSSVNTVARSIRRLTEIGVIQFISERGFSSRAYLTFLDSVDYGTEVFDCKNFRKCSERELIAVLKNRATYNHAERMEAAKVLCDGIVSRDQYLAGRITESHIEKVALSLANKDCTTLRRAVAYAKKSLYDSVVVLKEEELSLRITTNNRMQQSKKNDEEERIVVSEEEAEKLAKTLPTEKQSLATTILDVRNQLLADHKRKYKIKGEWVSSRQIRNRLMTMSGNTLMQAIYNFELSDDIRDLTAYLTSYLYTYIYRPDADTPVAKPGSFNDFDFHPYQASDWEQMAKRMRKWE